MSTAATTSALLPPKPTRIPVSPTSTIPIPPGVIGSEPSRRASDHAGERLDQAHLGGRHAADAERGEHHDEHRQLAGQRREGEHVPAAPEEPATVSSRKRTNEVPLQRTGSAADQVEPPVREPRREVTHLSREPPSREPGRERRDRDHEHPEPDQRNRLEQAVLLVLDRQRRQSDDREAEHRELVPDPGHCDGDRHRPPAEPPAAEHRVRRRDADGSPARARCRSTRSRRA